MTETSDGPKKKYLILTSSGGGGHISAAEARKQELISKGIDKEEIEVIDLMGLSDKASNKKKSWIPTIRNPIDGKEFFSGEANTKRWDELQKKGGIESVRELERLVDFQWIAERIQHNQIYTKLKEYLENNDGIEAIYNTQALSTPAICQAISEYNQEKKKDLKMVGTVTEFLSHRAVHFLDPLSKIKPEHRKVLEMEVVTEPFGDPGETTASFVKKHQVDDIEFKYLSKEGKPAPVKREFLDKESYKDKIIIKAKAVADKGELAEQKYIKEKLAGIDPSGDDFTINKGPNDKLVTITMGSQGSATTLEYVDAFVKQAIEHPQSDGNVYLCIAAGKNTGEESLYGKLRAHVEELCKEGKIPANVKILPLSFQDGKHMASLLQNSDVLITRSGGMSSMEAQATSGVNPNRRVYIHSEEKISSPENFPLHNYDSLYEGLISGTVKWEGGNAEYLMNNIGASLGSPSSVDFGLANKQETQKRRSLFHFAYDNKLNTENRKEIRNLIYEGSNPNLKFPGGSFLIDHCQDFDTKATLVRHGAHITKKSLEGLDQLEQRMLKEEEQKFIKDSHNHTSIIDTKLKLAIQTNDLKQIKGITHQFKNAINRDILLFAVENNNLEAVKILLSNGANSHLLKKRDKAVFNSTDDIEIKKELIKAGVKLERDKENGELEKVSTAYSQLFENTKKTIFNQYKISKNKESFTGEILRKFNILGNTDDKALSTKLNSLYEQLQSRKNEIAQMNIISRAVEKLMSMMGISQIDKEIKTQIKDLPIPKHTPKRARSISI